MSDITFIIGKIGAGKSLFGVIQITEALERSERMVVTNIPLSLPDLGEYCCKYITRPVDLNKRVRVLTDAEVRTFWLHLPGRDLESFEEVPKRQGDGGCVFLLDEVHLHFSARNWALLMKKDNPSSRVEEYMSQCRKLNDDVWLITQHEEKVDKNFRRNATQFLRVRNLGKQTLFLGVGFPGRFRWTQFCEEPKRGDKPEAAGWYNIKNRPYGKLYNTMAGVGFAGQQGGTEEQKKVKSPLIWAVAVVVVCVIAWAVPHYGMKGVRAATDSSISSVGLRVHDTLGNKKVVQTDLPARSAKPAVGDAGAIPPLLPSAVPPASNVVVIGWAVVPQRGFHVFLSDGKTVRTWDPGVELFDFSVGLFYRGKLFAIKE